MKLEEITVKQNYIHKGKIINLRVDDALLPNGEKCTREVVEHNGAVAVVALTDENEIIFVKQFRYPYKEVVLEIPAGKLEPGEDPFSAVQRELLEETGAVALKYADLGEFYPTPGYCNETIHLYSAKKLTFKEQNLDDDEFLEVEKIPLDRAVEMVLNNEIVDGKTQAAVLKTAIIKWFEQK